jgi:hypothetical protein
VASKVENCHFAKNISFRQINRKTPGGASKRHVSAEAFLVDFFSNREPVQ